MKTHEEGMVTEMEKIVEERNHLQNEINNRAQSDAQPDPVIEKIDQWQKSTIEKIKQIAAEARKQAVELLNVKQTNITTEFTRFSEELARLKESENYAEHDLARLNKMINQFKQDWQQSTSSTTILLHTEQSDKIKWETLIYVGEQAAAIGKFTSNSS